MVVEDGVEVAQQGVHGGDVQVVFVEVDVLRVAADGVEIVDGVEDLDERGSDAEDGTLVVVECVGGVAASAAGAGGDVVYGVEAVAIAGPAHVEVVAVLVVGAVEHEGVSAGMVGTVVIDGTALSQLLVDEAQPYAVVVGVALGVEERGVVFEVLPEGVGGAVGRPAAAARIGGAAALLGETIHHLDSHAAVEAEGGHGIALVLGREVLGAVGHVLPEVGGVTEIGGEGGVVEAEADGLGFILLSTRQDVELVHRSNQQDEQQNEIPAMQDFRADDITQIAFVGELVEDRGCGAPAREREIDSIGQVGDDADTVECQIDDAHYAMIAGTFLPMEGQKHQKQIERIEVEQGRCVEQEGTRQQVAPRVLGQTIVKGGPVEGNIYDAANHECHVSHRHVEKVGNDDTGSRTSERIYRFQSIFVWL